MNDIFYTCLEHIDMTIDDILDEKNQMPIMHDVSIDIKCRHCQQSAIYAITAQDVKIEWD